VQVHFHTFLTLAQVGVIGQHHGPEEKALLIPELFGLDASVKI
jgi:hypothetical protein